jgi:flagellar hook-length control protein FliK
MPSRGAAEESAQAAAVVALPTDIPAAPATLAAAEAPPANPLVAAGQRADSAASDTAAADSPSGPTPLTTEGDAGPIVSPARMALPISTPPAPQTPGGNSGAAAPDSSVPAVAAAPAAAAATPLIATIPAAPQPDPGAAPHGADTVSTSSQSNPDASALLTDPTTARAGGVSQSAAAAPSFSVHTEVGTSAWTEEIGAHLTWMAHQGVTDASLRLQPEHLGPLEVKITLHDTHASQGMTLADAGVSRESSREAQYGPRTPTPSTATTTESATPVSVAAPRRGLIDTYA